MQSTQTLPQPLRRLSLDVAYWLAIAAGCLYALLHYDAAMDAYDTGILVLCAAGLAWLGHFWKPMRGYSALVAVLAVSAISLYNGQLARAESVFGLKYLLSSQSAILWMSTLFFMATGAYWIGLLARSEFAARTGSGLTWAALVLGLTGMLVRWHESYLIAPDVGHIPVSNLYEVFVLFCVITGLMHLYYEQRSNNHQFGAFTLLIISAAVGFLLWYSFERQAHEIQPLIPALQSYWMKIHVPANFVGYGAFSLAAMLGVAYLLAVPNDLARVQRRTLQAAGVAVLLGAIAARVGWSQVENIGFITKMVGVGGILLWVAGSRGILHDRLPGADLLDDISYKAIAIGFAFFTVATILGALWAAEAWGGYWSWDPKETWALIVWLNYAAWLHMRLVKGLRGAVLAWWSVAGLAITTFAFLGVNMFLSGLHSYGSL